MNSLCLPHPRSFRGTLTTTAMNGQVNGATPFCEKHTIWRCWRVFANGIEKMAVRINGFHLLSSFLLPGPVASAFSYWRRLGGVASHQCHFPPYLERNDRHYRQMCFYVLCVVRHRYFVIFHPTVIFGLGIQSYVRAPQPCGAFWDGEEIFFNLWFAVMLLDWDPQAS